jgi:hypothetical protein
MPTVRIIFISSVDHYRFSRKPTISQESGNRGQELQEFGRYWKALNDYVKRLDAEFEMG